MDPSAPRRPDPARHAAAAGEDLLARADALRHLGDWAAAAACLDQLVAHDDSAPHARARGWRLLSEIERRRRRYPEALRAAQLAVALAEQDGDAALALLGRLAGARALSDSGQSKGALEQVDAVVAQAAEHLAGEPAALATVLVRAHTIQALVHFRRNDLAQALTTLEAVRPRLADVSDDLALGAWYRQGAILLELTQRYSAAIARLNQALACYDRVRYEPGRYDAWWSLAVSYTALGDLATARLCLDQCVALAERWGWRAELGKAKSSVAELAVRAGRYDEAVALFGEDLALSTDLGDEQALGHCHRKLAACYRLMGRPAQAGAHARASVAHFDATERVGEATGARLLLAGVLVAAGRIDEAAATLHEARRRAPGQTRPTERAALLWVEGLVARAKGQWDQAADRLAASLRLQHQGAPTRELALTELDAGLTLLQMGRDDQAAAHLRAAANAAGLVGSHDLWDRAAREMERIDPAATQELLVQPYLPRAAAHELRGGQAAAHLATATIMFVDMRGSTELSGHLAPLELAAVVDAFLGPVVRIILHAGGSVDKFIGDCVMAVFGLRADRPGDGAADAVRAGREILEYMEATKEVRRRSGAGVLSAAIGVNTGEVVSGCFGPLLRRDYTVLGYHVNLAERLQRLAGELGGEGGSHLVVAGATWRRLREPAPATRLDLSAAPLKGISPADHEAWLVEGPA